MRTTIDKAGRLVVPKALRDQVGLVAGEVELEVEGAGIKIEPIATGELIVKDGILMLKPGGKPVTVEEIRELPAWRPALTMKLSCWTPAQQSP